MLLALTRFRCVAIVFRTIAKPAVYEFDVMFAQYLGLFSSLKVGLKPDCPSPSGVISRVVSHVAIYR